jgi:predicted enzyme related to lactoylglutathione lyase
MTRTLAAALALLIIPAACVTSHTPVQAPPVAARPADPPIFVRSIRIAATDVPSAAEFYKKAFGMHEIRRIEGETFLEIVLNTGATVEAARANPRAPIVLMTRPKDLQVGAMANLILNVADMEAAIASVQAAGGTLFRAPQRSGAAGATYAFVKDPEGNQVELLTAR